MEEQVFQLISYTGFAGVAGLLVWRVIIPWSDRLLKSNGGTPYGLEAKVNKLENNDIFHIKEDLDSHKQEARENFNHLHSRVNALSNDVSFIKGKINGN